MLTKIVTEHVAYLDLEDSIDVEKTVLALRKAITDWSKRLGIEDWTIDSHVNNSIYVVGERQKKMEEQNDSDSN